MIARLSSLRVAAEPGPRYRAAAAARPLATRPSVLSPRPPNALRNVISPGEGNQQVGAPGERARNSEILSCMPTCSYAITILLLSFEFSGTQLARGPVSGINVINPQ